MKKFTEQEFRDYIAVTPDADVIEDRLATIAGVYLNEASYLSAVIAKKAAVQRSIKSRKADLYEEYRLKKSSDKTWTEAAIESAILRDKEVSDFLEDEALIETSIDLRKARVEALRMLNGNLQLLGRSILNEKFGLS